VHSVSEWTNLRHLGEPLGEAESLLEAVSFKKATESMGRGREESRMPDRSEFQPKTTGDEGSANMRTDNRLLLRIQVFFILLQLRCYEAMMSDALVCV